MAKAAAKKSNVVDLGKFKDAAEDLYESYQIRVEGAVVKLYNPIRIAPEARERVFELAKEFEFAEDHKFEAEDLKRIHPAVLEILELVGDDNVFMLIENIRNDLVVAINVFTDYFQTVNLGEASSSES
jgi:Mycobacteriophage tail assembly protein